MKIEKLFMEIDMKWEMASALEKDQLEKSISTDLEKATGELDPVDRVFLARYKNRPKGLDFVENLIQDPIYFHGDRSYSDDPALVCGVGLFANRPAYFIAIHKGRDMKESMACNFGMVHPEGYRKAIRIMYQAEKFQRPLLIFIDTPGAYPGIGAEERGQGESIASSIYAMARLKTRILSVITGEGASGGAIALGAGDRMLMMENSIYSILSPEGFASILWRDANRKEEAMRRMKLTAEDLLESGIIDQVVEEKLVYFKEDFSQNFLALKKALENHLKELDQFSIEELVKMRREKFRRYEWV